MEKQSNSVLEPTNAKETLTYTVGQSPSPATPSLNLVYADPDGSASMYLIDSGDGELHVHVDVKGEITKSRLKHFEEVFLAMVLGLIERGLDHIGTWVQSTPEQIRFAEFFGFEETGFFKLFRVTQEDEPIVLREMIYIFPPINED